MAYFAVTMRERSSEYIEREIELHDNPAAHQFKEDASASTAPLDVQQWCAAHAGQFNLGLTEAEGLVSPAAGSYASST